MFDWEIADDQESAPHPAVDEPDRLPRRALILLVVGLLLLGLIVAVAVRWRLNERREAMRADLSKVVQQEEQARQFGLQEQAGEFAVPDAPADWQDSYRSTFESRSVPAPVDVQLDDVTLEDSGALVTVRLGSAISLRYYRLIDGHWRRAPVPVAVWGDVHTYHLSDTLEIHYRSRDQDFARALADDLPGLLNELAQWPTGMPDVHRIDLEPAEFRGGVLQRDAGRLTVNSPLVVDTGNIRDGTAVVRQAVAEELVAHAAPAPDQLRPLPGAVRFLRALTTVAAMHWALSESEHESLVETWRVRLSDGWTSPFFATEIGTSEDQTRTEAAALIAAEYVYQLGGSSALADVSQRMTRRRSWDAVFEAAVERDTRALQHEVAVFARDGMDAVRNVTPDIAATPADLPATATLLESGPADRLLISVAGSDDPIVVETHSSLQMQTQDGDSVHLPCVGTGSELQIDGRWYEEGLRMQGNSIVFTDPVPPALSALGAVPADTIAYLEEGHTNPPTALSAYRTDGTISSIVTLPHTTHLRLLPGRVEEPTEVLFTHTPDQCNRIWLVLYEAESGRVDSWLLPSTLYLDSIAWDAISWLPSRQALLLVGRSTVDQEWSYGLLTRGRATIEPLPLEVETSLEPLGWSRELERVIAVDTALAAGRQRVAALDITSGERKWYTLMARTEAVALSHGGRWLAYSIPTRTDKGWFDTIRLLDLSEGNDTVLIDVGPDEERMGLTWTADRTGEYVLVLSGVRRVRPVAATRLVAFDPRQPQIRIPITLSHSDARIRAPDFCPDGSILYSVTRTESDVGIVTTLMSLRAPGVEPRSLVRGEPFTVLRCIGTPVHALSHRMEDARATARPD